MAFADDAGPACPTDSESERAPTITFWQRFEDKVKTYEREYQPTAEKLLAMGFTDPYLTQLQGSLASVVASVNYFINQWDVSRHSPERLCKLLDSVIVSIDLLKIEAERSRPFCAEQESCLEVCQSNRTQDEDVPSFRL
ncbi:MAG: hypothetical protein K0S08_353 [Gammaproteobacteria bacterium]|jgi:hypothetical protein|nr:hypothetical protein [Gammaproteobacteria bacterium]